MKYAKIATIELMRLSYYIYNKVGKSRCICPRIVCMPIFGKNSFLTIVKLTFIFLFFDLFRFELIFVPSNNNTNMRKLVFVAMVSACLVGCKTSKTVEGNGENAFWQTMLLQQTESNIDNGIITAKYENGSTLYFRIVDNFGNVALTWDRSQKSFDAGESAYSGNFEVPSYVFSGENREFMFRVTQVDENTFYGCKNITSVTIPFSVFTIGNNAFLGCTNLQKISVNEYNTNYKSVDGVLFSKDGKMLAQYPAKKKQSEYMISEDVVAISPSAFRDCANLEIISIGDGVAFISDFAFRGCQNLKEVILGKSLRITGREAFFDCPKLSVIHSRSTFIPHNSPKVYESSTKENCKLYVPADKIEDYKRHLEWNEFKNITAE